MEYLGIDEADLEKSGGIFTAKEISGQPCLWAAIRDKIIKEKLLISQFLGEALPEIDTIILTGAGTSAFIGHSVSGEIQRKTCVPTFSIATTHLVSHAQNYFMGGSTILLISFARSGNSPESVQSMRLADQHCKSCYHLTITCNEDGDLAKYNLKDKGYAFILPSEANDKSLAMTGSYSGMLLSALLINTIDQLDVSNQMVDTVIAYGNTILEEYRAPLRKIADLPFKRAIFLGSGPQYGTAMESHLKLQELTDGQVVCIFDSFLGFRHGPKAVVDEETLMVYYFSNNPDVLRYEKDLVKGMDKGKKPLHQLGISDCNLDQLDLNSHFQLPQVDTDINESFLSVSTILLGQLMAFYKSVQLGLSPDSPSSSKAISRVVEGVVIY